MVQVKFVEDADEHYVVCWQDWDQGCDSWIGLGLYPSLSAAQRHTEQVLRKEADDANLPFAPLQWRRPSEAQYLSGISRDLMLEAWEETAAYRIWRIHRYVPAAVQPVEVAE